MAVQYGMVIDAGSSHTTIYTYKVGVDVSSNNMTGEVEEIDNFNISSKYTLQQALIVIIWSVHTLLVSWEYNNYDTQEGPVGSQTHPSNQDTWPWSIAVSNSSIF